MEHSFLITCVKHPTKWKIPVKQMWSDLAYLFSYHGIPWPQNDSLAVEIKFIYYSEDETRDVDENRFVQQPFCKIQGGGRASVNGRTGVLYARKFDQNARN